MAKGNGSANGSIGDSDIAVERELPCKLTEVELLARGEAQAEAELKIEALKAERRELNRAINVQVDERNKLAHTIDSGLENRKVVCKWIADFEHNVWNLIRQDTGEQVEQRTMTAADRQGALPLDAPLSAPEEVSVVDGEILDEDPLGVAEVEVDGDTEVPEKKKGKRASGAKAKGKSKGKAKSQRAHA
jgi:hypothetical protein